MNATQPGTAATGLQPGCGAPAGGVATSTGASGEAVIEGHVTRDGSAPAVGYARLLDKSGEFVAEVPLGEDGGFRFFAAPGTWTVRTIVPGGGANERVGAAYGQVTRVELNI